MTLSDADIRLREKLDSAVERIETAEFVEADPVQFPRMFSSLPDIEIAAFCAAIMAWGNRKLILRDVRRLLEIMDMQPHKWVMERGYAALDPLTNIHRTLFAGDLARMLRAMRKIYLSHSSLEDFMNARGIAAANAPAWEFASHLQAIMLSDGEGACPQCLPTRIDTTALKRFNMAFRWLARRNSPVDLGVWESISPARLFIPLDVHVARISRSLGLLARRSNDRKAVEELTARLRAMRPDDPVAYDFALFGLGISPSPTSTV